MNQGFDCRYGTEQIHSKDICSPSAGSSFGVDQLLERHDRLLRRWDISSYALDIREHIALRPQAFDDDALLADYCDIGLADIREQALIKIDAVLGVASPDSILSTAAPVSDRWWISLSADGRIAAHVESRLAKMKVYRAAPLHQMPKSALRDLEEVFRILDLCEGALAAARICLAAFDFKAALSDLLQCEISAEFYS